MNRLIASLFMMMVAISTPAAADLKFPQTGVEVLPTEHGFEQLWKRLEQAIDDNGLGIVSRASASRGAASRGLSIPGNAVIGVFRNDLAVRMLAASVPAGIEAPLRFYLVENPDQTATLIYRRPTAVFAPYGSAALDDLAKELDGLFSAIATQAADTR